MRIILTLSIILSFVKSFSQENTFIIKGSIKGENAFAYVYAFDNEYNLIQKSKIENNNFLIKGNYSQTQRFGEIPFITLVLSNENESEEALLARRALSNRKHFNVMVIAEAEINVLYDATEKRFTVEGGELNKLQNQFNNINHEYRKLRDSAYLVIDKTNLAAKEKEDEKLSTATGLFDKTVLKMMGLVEENQSSKVVLFNFSPIIYNQSVSGATVMTLFSKLSAELRNSEYGQHILMDIEDKLKNEALLASPKYTLGMKFPTYELPNSVNVKVKSSSDLAKFTLVDFWATWCGPCRQETPNLIVASNKFKSKGLKIISISIDDERINKNGWKL